MIDISVLPPQARKVLRNDPFIFKSSNGREVNIPSFSAIVDSDDLINVIDVLELEDFNSGIYPFYLQHNILFYKAQKLFSELFDVEPDVLIYTYKSDSKVSAFIFSNREFIKKAINNEAIEIKITKNKELTELIDNEKKKGIKHEKISEEEKTIEFSLQTGVFPLIGVLNSLDTSFRVPNFNLIYGTKRGEWTNNILTEKLIDSVNSNQTKDKNPGWYSNIDTFLIEKFNKNGISLYSIGKNDFVKTDKYIAYPYYNPNNPERYLDELVISTQVFFEKLILQFSLAENRGRYLPISVEEFSAAMPHFHDLDRTLESVKYFDDNKKAKLKNLYNTATIFANQYSGNLTCKKFIDFFLRDSIIDFLEFQKDPGAEILKAFKEHPQTALLINPKREILSQFITAGMPNLMYTNFLNGPDGQVQTKNKIYPIL